MHKTHDLLSLTILPIVFYESMIKESKPKDNPGVQLRSYILAKGLDTFYLDIPPELNDSIEQCKAFNNNLTPIITFIGYELFYALQQVNKNDPMHAELTALLADKAVIDASVTTNDIDIKHKLVCFQNKFSNIMNNVSSTPLVS